MRHEWLAVVLWLAFVVSAAVLLPPPGAAFRMTVATAAQDPAAVEASLGLDRPTRRLIQQGLRSEGFDAGAPDGQGQRQRWDPCPARAGINRWEVAGHAGHKHRSRRSGNEQLTAGQEPAAPGDEPIATCGQCRPPKLPPRTRG